MGAAWAIASKDVRLLLRDRMGFFFAFFFPLIVAVLFGVIFAGGGKSVKIGLVVCDQDGTEESRALIGQLAADPQLEVEQVGDREAAVGLVRGGKATAVIVVPKGYAAEREGMFFSTGAEVELGVDPSRFAERGMLEGLLLKHGFLGMQRVFESPARAREELRESRARLAGASGIDPIRKMALGKLFNDLEQFVGALPEGGGVLPGAGGDPGASAAGGWEPMRIRSIDVTSKADTAGGEGGAGPRPPSSFAVTFPQGIIWGVMGCALGFSISMVSERTRGTLVRLRVAPIGAWQILAGKSLACFATTIAVSVFLIAIGVLAFGVRPTSWPMLGVAVACTGACFVGIMMLLAVMSPTERSGNGLGWGVLLMLSMIGGGMLPLFFMPEWMRTISVISPIRWSILAIEGGLWRGSGWGELVLPCAILLGVGAVGVLAGSRLLQRQTDA